MNCEPVSAVKPDKAQHPAGARVLADISLALTLPLVPGSVPDTFRETLERFFEKLLSYQCEQCFIEPCTTAWRCRYRCLDGYVEEFIDGAAQIDDAFSALQAQTADGNTPPGELFHHSMRFSLHAGSRGQFECKLQSTGTIKGKHYSLDIAEHPAYPPMLDQLGLSPDTLRELRESLVKPTGMLVVTGPEPRMLDELMVAIAQDINAPDRKVLYLCERHRYSLPRSTQIDTDSFGPAGGASHGTALRWQHALSIHHDTLLFTGTPPRSINGPVANFAAHNGRVIQALPSSNVNTVIDLQTSADPGEARLYQQIDSILVQHPVRTLCPHCSKRDPLDNATQEFLKNCRTPASENIVSWLLDGDLDRFLCGEGCQHCNNTGFAGNTVVYEFFCGNLTSCRISKQMQRTGKALQQQLMQLAKTGQIPIREVIRVTENS